MMLRLWFRFLKEVTRWIYHSLKVLFSTLRAWIWFQQDFRRYCQLIDDKLQRDTIYIYPQLHDKLSVTPVDATYFYQDAWAFELITKARPSFHVDVGSHHKFVSLLSKVVPVTMVDIRPLTTPLESLDFKQGTILEMPFEDDSISSLSSLCVVEHIGLGRYGDPLDPAGTEKALQELKRVLAPGGELYLSIPLDDENRTYFNAHRAFNESYLLSLFAPLEVLEKRYIFKERFLESIRPGFGTGCYHLRKPM